MSTINGKRVFVVPEYVYPKQKLNSKILVSAEFRVNFDLWLLDFFGYKVECAVPDGQMIEANGSIFVNQNTFNELRKSPDFRCLKNEVVV